jgi:hypothetical protein
VPSVYATFDSNVYEGISPARFKDLRRLERANSVVGGATYWVALDMLAHLATPGDRAFGGSWAGLRRLVAHCGHYDGSRRDVP